MWKGFETQWNNVAVGEQLISYGKEVSVHTAMAEDVYL